MRLRLLAVLLVLFLLPLAAPGQSKPENDWVHVQGLLPGTYVLIAARSGNAKCNITKVDADSVTCTSRYLSKTQTFQRADVKTIKTNHRAKSTLIGLGVGTAAGAIFGVSVGRSGSFVGHGAATIIFAIPGAIVGTIIGAAGNFAHTLVYRAP